MVCNECGASNENDAAFCIHCGESFSKLRKIKNLLHEHLSHTTLSFRSPHLFKALFDISFKQFVSIKIIKVVYALSIFSAALAALVCIIAGFYGPRFLGIFMLLIGAPLIFLLIVLYSRVIMELVLFNFGTGEPKVKQEEPPEPVDSIEWNV